MPSILHTESTWRAWLDEGRPYTGADDETELIEVTANLLTGMGVYKAVCAQYAH